MKNKNKQEESVMYMPVFMSIGISVGVAIGAAMGNIPICMCIGLSVGLCIGMVLDAQNRKNAQDNENNPSTGTLKPHNEQEHTPTDKDTQN